MKNFFRNIFILIIISILIYSYARYIEPNLLNVHHKNIDSKLVENNKNEIKILQFSDTHISESFDMEDLQNMVNKINDENADIVVFSGDLIDHFNDYDYKGDVDKIWQILSEINAPLGKYAIYGNHDYGGGAERIYKKIMENSGFVLLINENYKIHQFNINIIGLDDSIFGNFDASLMNNLSDENFYNIVLSHEPDVVDSLLEYNVDLILSGHSHGGQVNVPFLSSAMLPELAKKYTRGLYEFENFRNTNLYVNIGIGTSQIPFRFMAVPELSVINLK
ncbi:MAG: Ser/Thr protein phosphatase family protein [Bacillota bacterium]|nr:Ser/Thr protein phosphatase family protein [Bacillota bacterium]